MLTEFKIALKQGDMLMVTMDGVKEAYIIHKMGENDFVAVNTQVPSKHPERIVIQVLGNAIEK